MTMTPEQEERLYKMLGSNNTTARVRPAGQHVYHHTVSDGPKLNVKVERNSKGYNWEVTVTGAASPDQALELIAHTEERIKAQYGATPTE